jgi:hypothetical protein
MHYEELHKLYKISGEGNEGYFNKRVENLKVTYSDEEIEEGLRYWKSKNHRNNFDQFLKDHQKIIRESKQGLQSYQPVDNRVKIIIDGIIEAMEYRIQKDLNNPEITHTSDRSKYLHPNEKMTFTFNDKMTSFSLQKSGEIKIIENEIESLLSDKINDLSWLSVGEFCFNWIMVKKIEYILYIVFSDMFFESYEPWRQNLPEIIRDIALLNKLIIMKYNERQTLTFSLNNEVEKLSKTMKGVKNER